jgi:predicted small lipoprotein YifL
MNAHCKTVAAIAALTLSSCGRLQFGPLDVPDAGNDASAIVAIDAPLDSAFESLSVGLVVRFPMDVDPITTLLIVAEPPQFTIPCSVRTGTCPTAAAGQIGTGSYNFDGNVRTVLGNFVSMQPYTVSLWLNPEASTMTMSAISNDLGPANSLNEMAFRVGATTVAYEGAEGASVKDLTLTLDLHSAWHLVTMTWDGTERVLYIDGTERIRGNATWVFGNRPLGIGADLDFGNVNLPYRGAMDDLRIYDRALKATEVALLFTLR